MIMPNLPTETCQEITNVKHCPIHTFHTNKVHRGCSINEYSNVRGSDKGPHLKGLPKVQIISWSRGVNGTICKYYSKGCNLGAP